MSVQKLPKENQKGYKQTEIRKVIQILSAGLVLVIVLLIGYFISQNIENKTQEKLREILRLENELGELLSAVQDAETGQRGFLLTSREKYLEPYNRAIKDIPTLVEELGSNFKSNELLASNIETLEKLIEEKLDELKTTIEYNRNGQREAALDLVNTDKGKKLMQQMRVIVKQLKTDGYESLKENNEEINLINYIITTIQIAGLIAILFIFYNIYSMLRPLIENLVESNEQLEKGRENLKEKNEQLERFAYIASHDLNEPLRTITSMITILQEDYGNKFDEEAKQNFEFITLAAGRMKSMIDGILNYSRIGKSARIEEIEIEEIIKELKNDLALLIDKKQATIDFQNLPKLKGYRVELRQLFQNLLTNSLKFSKEDVVPNIEIRAEEYPTKWKFSFKDNGIGIPKEHQKKIFGIFAKLHRKSEYEGQGIGLAFCKKIIALHRGKIRVESELGVGTTFYFTISKKLNQQNYED
ncbi:sensor histidine kinase [Bernardetia sp.]|uniref:sensor histidine kinase n=1 Tax=Bernardetia sp. TaxID=1937974 RepID=UPI0025C1EDC1|nr:sensor histidine kinase [Bernardetia sp.]